MEIVNQMKIEILALPENVGVARIALASFASQLDLTIEDMDDIKLVISEAVSNCIIHGYQGGRGRIWITGIIYPGRLEMFVEDKGKGIEDIEKAREPAYSSDPERMGMGLTLIEALMDEMEIKSEPGKGTLVRMLKVIQPINESRGQSLTGRLDL